MFNINKYIEIKDFLKKSTEFCEIVAVSKNHPKETIIEAIKSGVRIFGENRVLEAKSKFTDLKKEFTNIELHLTGPLQSNKVKEAILLFDVFHTLDRKKIADEFSKYTDKLISKKIFIQVNTGKEESKSGIYPHDLKKFLQYCINEAGLSIKGLMCIPPINDDPTKHFKLLKELAIENKLSELSIGMSGDYELATKYNPTYIRIGTILFGQRKYK